LEVLSEIVEFYREQQFAHQFVTAFIVFLLLLSFVLFANTMISRAYKIHINNRKAKISDKYETLIAELLFDTNHPRTSPEYRALVLELRVEFKDSLHRKVFTQILIDLQKNLTGESADYISTLFKDLGLKKFAINRINSGPWYEKAKAFREIALFEVKEEANLLATFTKHPREEVRSEARFTLVKLLGFKGLEFLDDKDIQLSNWQQLSILEELKHKEKKSNLYSFVPLLSSESPDVVVLALKLIDYFKQIDALKAVENMIEHDIEKISKQALICLRAIGQPKTALDIIKHYPYLTIKNQIEAIKTLEQIATDKEKFFLLKETDSEEYGIVLHAALALKNLGLAPELNHLLDLKKPYNKKIIQHALDERI
jgi:HEAT repeat protein